MIDIEQEPDRRRRYQMRREAAGLVRVNVYVPKDQVEDFRAHAQALCDAHLRKSGWEPRRGRAK
jgi:hypothetical protein